ncbi:hypothetical protein GCM10007160_20110 [Litchfieldella qijiaojingensis]|uniref:Uncharacterized protein n=1 Tax=Litchfieldella qijiaojingensis TaxID=980347 RepID=A0ABQ2YR24_9GAMM|nr:hypothetical protein [Halomonas qijiaojingensis]GGX92586.1 hypothetical protein GCM10007160_20110 [Halomonas qijiaojingensis]
MFQRRERNILEIIIWSVTALLSPYSTYLIIKYGDAALIGAPLVNAVLFVAAMLCTKINTSLNDELFEGQEESASHAADADEDIPDELIDVGGLRVLRVAKNSPLRGFGLERGIIRSINGGTPASAEEANQLLVPGNNEIVWVARSGKAMTSTIHTKEIDLKAQFEQIKPRQY